jgi:glycerol-3-phosphate O-acyltransferase
MDTSSKEMTEYFFNQTKVMMHKANIHKDLEITPENVYQEAHKDNRETLFETIMQSHLEGSTILGVENLKELNRLAQEGKSCLILSEHVSNLDVPNLFTRFYDHEDESLRDIFEKLTFVAGVKLNQNHIVKLYTEMFTRVVIYPIRSLGKIATDPAHKAEVDLAKKINIRATRTIAELRNKDRIFVMYPAGTRYRPWMPETKRGIKETMSYINSFDYILFCSINGNNMPPREHEDMTREPYIQDVIVFNFGPVYESKHYIDSVLKQNTGLDQENKDEVKQYVVDQIMAGIDHLHEDAENYRKQYLPEL